MTKRIVQVYKGAGDWRAAPPGIGDFIRGICHLHELTQRYGLDLRVDISLSDLASCLNFDDRLFCESDPEDIRTASEHNDHVATMIEIMDFILSDRETLFICTNLGDWSRSSIPESTRAFLRPFYNFSANVRSANLWAPERFAVLTVRCGDNYFGNDEKRLPRLQRAMLTEIVDRCVSTVDIPLLVASDSLRAKKELEARYGFKAVPNSPSHGATGNALPAMMDLDLLSRSVHNYHINLWRGWWSGFSHYTSLIFGIPETNVLAPSTVGSRAVLQFAIRHPLRVATA